MGNNKLFKAAVFIILLGLFFLGLGMLARARFESGSIYPPYSTMLREPAGARAIYEALDLLPGIEVQRNTEEFLYHAKSSGRTIFVLGLSGRAFSSVDDDTYKDLEKCLQAGDRLVIAFSSAVPSTITTDVKPEQASEEHNVENSQKEDRVHSPKKEEKSHAQGPLKVVLKDLRAQWGIDFDHMDGVSKTAQLRAEHLGLVPSIEWVNKSNLAFVLVDSHWKVVYAVQDKPVIVEKPVGKGSIVLLSDSFLFTNEAIKGHRVPELLSWLCGPHHIMVFDEAHLGILEQPNVATIIKRNGLRGFFVSLAVLGMLVIWRQLVPVVPLPKKDASTLVASGRGYREGMANLFRRNIPKDQILSICVDEWERAFTRNSDQAVNIAKGVRQIIEEDASVHRRTWNAEETYERIRALVAKSKILSKLS
jgi:hypothetical protein